jgi:TolB-like protein/Tfp pilus assembly protein PilF
LVDATTGAYLWAETYNRPFQPDAIFSLQDDLVPRIVATVADRSGVLPHRMSETLRGRKPHELTPYETVLRAFGFYERMTPDEHAEVRACLEQAVEKAPDLADAWASLSFAYQDEYRLECNPRPDPLGRALAAARRAVETGPSNHAAHAALASVMFFRRDFPAFRRAAERAIALNPMDADTVAYMGALMAYGGDWERGCGLVERSIPLNPHHAGWFWMPLVHNAYRQHDYAGALDAAVKVNLPGYFYVQAVLVAVYGQLGEREMARGAVAHLVALKPDMGAVAREELGKWLYYQPDVVEHVLEGLRKAGLDVPASESHVSSAAPVVEHVAHATSISPSIAVLPFASMSADPDSQYFSDGLAEELINALTHLPRLHVASRTSAFRFRARDVDIKEIGRALRVTTVLEGSVRRTGNRLRVTAQLIDVADGYHRWSERYDREMADVFDIQDDIVASIIKALAPALVGNAKAAVKRHTENLEAYETYLKGRQYWYQRSPTSVPLAIRSFEQTIALDPNYTLAYAGLADCHTLLRPWGASETASRPPAEAALKRAMALDPILPEVQLSQALFILFFERAWLRAEPYFQRAIELNPRWPLARAYYAAFLAVAYRGDEASGQASVALDLDPLSPFVHAIGGGVLWMGNASTEAERLTRQALDLQPDHPVALMVLVQILTSTGRVAEATPVAEPCVALSRAPSNVGLLGMVHGLAGRGDDLTPLERELEERMSREEYIIPSSLVQIAIGRADGARVRAALERCLADNTPFAHLRIMLGPLLDEWRTNVAIDELLERLGDGVRPPDKMKMRT